MPFFIFSQILTEYVEIEPRVSVCVSVCLCVCACVRVCHLYSRAVGLNLKKPVNKVHIAPNSNRFE